MPSTDQTERNLEIWVLAAQGEDLRELGGRYALSLAGIRGVIRRIEDWRGHLAVCPAGGLGCSAPEGDLRDSFDLAHRRVNEINALNSLQP